MPASFDFPVVSLTVLNGENGQAEGVVAMQASRLLCYEQHWGFTRLRLSEGAWLDVREGTDEIDRRVRLAATQAQAARRAFQLGSASTLGANNPPKLSTFGGRLTEPAFATRLRPV